MSSDGERKGSGPGINVAVQNANGELLELEAEPNCTIFGLKCRVAECWQVPPCCQRLAPEDAAKPLEDDATLAEQQEDSADSQVKLIMAVSSEEVFKCLEDEDCSIRRMAVQTLGQVAHKDFGKAMEALGTRLNDPEWEVRRAAVELLGQVAPRGDEGAVGVAKAHLQDRSVSVKQVSILTLAQLSAEGDADVINELIPMLEDKDDGVRRAVAEALSELAPPGDVHVIEVVSGLLDHWSVLVKRAAIETLARVGEKGDVRLIEKFGSFLGQEPGLIRVAAVLGIGQLSTGEKLSVSLVMACLEDPDERVQAAAAFVLREAGLSLPDESDPRMDKAPQGREQSLRDGPGASKASMRRTASA